MTSQATNDGYLRKGRKPKPDDVFIAVMGVTGAGKSTLISLCCEEPVEIGHDLNGCTTIVEVYPCNYGPTRTVYLIDTPGFDDTNRSDTEVLREVASWLTASYSNKIRLSGIIYLHRISDLRMQGSAKKNLFLFQKLCGSEALKNVILATTMWDRVNFEEGLAREKQLVETQEFWGWMMDQGSRIFRHSNDHRSARRLIDIFLGELTTVTLELQNQMVNEKLSLEETDAGITLEGELSKERARWEKRLRETQEEMKEALESRNQDAIAAIQQLQRDYQSRMDRLEQDRHDLRINMERLHQEKYAGLEAKLRAQEEALKAQRESYDIELSRLRSEKDEHKLNLQAAEKREKDALDALERLKLDSEQFPRPQNMHRVEGRPVSLALRGGRIFLCSASGTYRRVNGSLETKTNFLAKPETVAFGDGDSYVASYRDKDWHLRWSWGGGFPSLYPDVYSIRKNGGWKMMDFITFGENGRYFMRLHGGETRHTLPTQLLGRILKDYPRSDVKQLALGRGDRFVVVFRDGRYRWNLDGYYKPLNEELQRLKESKIGIEAIALDCTSSTRYILVTMDREFYWHVGNSQVSHVRNWRDNHL